MNAASITILLFIIMEATNVFMLYFFPGSRKGNGLGIFNAYEESKNYPEIHTFIRYLIAWVAGTKLIFIALLVVILFNGSRMTRLLSSAVLIPSIATFFWRLYPLIKGMDEKEQITPKGYSRTLMLIITVFLAGFTFALVISFI